MSHINRPNIVFIIADDHRFDSVGYAGNANIQTPVLDQLAAEGTAFMANRIMGGYNGAVCVPSRACLLSGVNILDALEGGPRRIKPELTTMPQAFGDAGYETFATGKWHNDIGSFARSFSNGGKILFGGMSPHEQVPVHDYDPKGEYPDEKQYIDTTFSTRLFTDTAIDFIYRRQSKQPYFLYVAYTAPHDPRISPEPYASLFKAKDLPLPINFAQEHPFDNGEMDNRDERLEAWPRKPEAVQQHLADYYGIINHMDTEIGRIIEAVCKKGELENTIFVYTSDHGIALGQHGLMGKQNVYEHSIRVPMLMKGPGVPQGLSIDSLTYTYDLYPTLCELTGTKQPESVDAISLVPQLHGEKEQLRETVFTLYKDLQRTVTNGEWKLIRYYRSEVSQSGTDKLQLFHIAEDPWETNDLSDNEQYLNQMTRLAAAMKSWQQEMNDTLLKEEIN
jgi:arylsulfatase A-like enzyme